jgi:hypothetical protein
MQSGEAVQVDLLLMITSINLILDRYHINHYENSASSGKSAFFFSKKIGMFVGENGSDCLCQWGAYPQTPPSQSLILDSCKYSNDELVPSTQEVPRRIKLNRLLTCFCPGCPTLVISWNHDNSVQLQTKSATYHERALVFTPRRTQAFLSLRNRHTFRPPSLALHEIIVVGGRVLSMRTTSHPHALDSPRCPSCEHRIVSNWRPLGTLGWCGR